MKRLVVRLTLAILLVGLALFGLSDTVISIADTSIPDNEVGSSGSEADDHDPSNVTITITMKTPPLPDE